MMFADAEHIEAGPVSDFDLFDEVSHAIGRGRKSARDRIGEDGCKTGRRRFPWEIPVGLPLRIGGAVAVRTGNSPSRRSSRSSAPVPSRG